MLVFGTGVLGGVYALSGSGGAQLATAGVLLLIGPRVAQRFLGRETAPRIPFELSPPAELVLIWVAVTVGCFLLLDWVLGPGVVGPWFLVWIVFLLSLELLLALQTWTLRRYPTRWRRVGGLRNTIVIGVGFAALMFVMVLILGEGARTALLNAAGCGCMVAAVQFATERLAVRHMRRRSP